jgi:hypothetical protein
MHSNVVEIPLTLRLSERSRAELADRAAKTGRDVADVASDLIEEAVARGTAEGLLAPFRKQVAESGMSDEELDGFLRGELEAHRREREANAG